MTGGLLFGFVGSWLLTWIGGFLIGMSVGVRIAKR